MCAPSMYTHILVHKYAQIYTYLSAQICQNMQYQFSQVFTNMHVSYYRSMQKYTHIRLHKVRKVGPKYAQLIVFFCHCSCHLAARLYQRETCGWENCFTQRAMHPIVFSQGQCCQLALELLSIIWREKIVKHSWCNWFFSLKGSGRAAQLFDDHKIVKHSGCIRLFILFSLGRAVQLFDDN